MLFLRSMSIFFRDFELDVDRYLLMEDGRPVRLRPKAFDLLAYLVKHRARVVRRAELVDAVWGHTSVGPGSLSGLVNELRSALGEDAGSESSIRTVHARGYQFVAPVRDEPGLATTRIPPRPPLDSAPAGPSAHVPASVLAHRRVAIRGALLDTLRRFGVGEGDPATRLLDPVCEAVVGREPLRPMRSVRRESERRSSKGGGAGT